MPNNITANTPITVVAVQTATFAAAGIDGSNVYAVFLIDPLTSWKPGRTINGITGFVAGETYYIEPKIDMDLTEYVAVPVSMEYFVVNSKEQMQNLSFGDKARKFLVRQDESNQGRKNIYEYFPDADDDTATNEVQWVASNEQLANDITE